MFDMLTTLDAKRRLKMEEELNYATVDFKNGAKAPQGGGVGGAPHTRRFYLHVCLGFLCVLLMTSIIIIHKILWLTMKNEILEKKMEELSRGRDHLNWTLGVIMMFDSFPVQSFCPGKKCRPCRDGWILFQNHCYLFWDGDAPWKTWEDSQSYCEEHGANLSTIDSLREQEFISVHTSFYWDRFHGYWFGLHTDLNGDWFWTHGPAETKGFWMDPPVIYPGPCSMVMPGHPPTASWDSTNCSMRNRFICEHNALIRT